MNVKFENVCFSKRKDLINNTISRHRSNNYQPCSVPELTSFLRTNKDLFSAIVYCRRKVTEDIFQELLKSEVLVLSVTKHLISKRKRKTQPGKYSQLHQEAGLEIKTLETVLRHQYNFERAAQERKRQELGQKADDRIEFLKQCLSNDIIPDFLRFGAPKNDFFSEQAVHSFQLKLLKQEINRAEKDRKVFKEKLETDRSNFRENVKPELMPSVVSCIKLEMRNHSAMVQSRLNGKLDNLSERQDRPLRNGSRSDVVIMDGRELPTFVLDFSSLGPKQPVKDKFNEVHFLADVDKLVRELRENNTEVEKLCEIEASAKWCAKNVRETSLDRGVKKVHDYLKDNDLLAVPFDKG